MMKYRQEEVSVWPAFADLMTVLAVALACALFILVARSVPREKFDQVINARDQLVEKVEDANMEIEKLRNVLIRLGVDPDNPNPSLGPGPGWCLGRSNGDPVPLLEVVAGAEFTILPSSEIYIGPHADSHGMALNLLRYGKMNHEEFLEIGRRMLQYGDSERTFGGKCRFFVVIHRDSIATIDFLEAADLIERFFYIANRTSFAAERRRVIRLIRDERSD